MSDLSGKTACVVDGGMFSEVAVRLARDFERVLFHCTINNPFPKANELSIGEYDNVEVIHDLWPEKDNIDLFVFPDCANVGLQAELRGQGFKVWGSGDGAYLELQRRAFKGILMEAGLEVGPYQICKGLKELRTFLADKKDRYIKVSLLRGSMETKHWIDARQSAHILDELAITFGPVGEFVSFIVEEAIPTEIEWGLDTYFAGGKFPRLVMHGPEIKDKCYTGSLVEWKDLPEPVRMVAEAMIPVFGKQTYANMVSMEIRINEDGRAFFTDPTCRFPSPAGEVQMELYRNFSDIIWAGAHDECIEPQVEERFGTQCVFDHDGEEDHWRTLVIPEKVRRWVKLYSGLQVQDDFYAVPPFPHLGPSIGSVIGLGFTLEEAIDHLKAHAKELDGQSISVPVTTLCHALDELKEAEKQGVELTSTRIPGPEIVVSDT